MPPPRGGRRQHRPRRVPVQPPPNGVGRAGALDPVSLQQANALLRQDLTLPALEICGGPLQLEFLRDTSSTPSRFSYYD